MGFSQAQYEAAVNKVTDGANGINTKIGQVAPAANSAMDHWYIPGFIKDAIKWLAEKITQLAQWILNKIIELLKGAIAPIRMFVDAFDWQDIRGLASGVSGQLKDTALTVDDVWHGSARDAYVKAMKPQSDAADRVAKIGDKVSTSLTVCAVAGLAFYVALGVIVVKFIAAMVTAIAAFGTAVFSWAGAALIVEEAGVNTGLIIAAVTTLTALLGAQAAQMSTLHGEAVDASMFPGGKWPNPVVAGYSDGSVKDGDADWSLKG
ncbi:hypothetical protein HDA40_000683 [Hamadaea flava]|uniref:Uncharacterized protein n=1 Tax=Hamadaea flava TaxID=1742688 RepID=A0ABV8LYI1_9ACTN|nr:hypothetical protein [Hamadaea flava]MCP2322176.1 hypothetical protein [Hamadaea flava]